MRSRTSLFVLLFIAGSLALPSLAHAGGIPFFGPIVPDEVNKCAAGWGMLMIVINNVISLLITLAVVFVAPLSIAYSGFLYVVNPVDPGGIAKAKGILTNTIVGIVIALAGWMIVDALMAVLYNPSKPGETWANLLMSKGDICIPLAESLKQAEGQPPGIGVTGVSGKFSFATGIDAQVPTESSALSSLLSCMSGTLTTNAIITSISDSKITSGQQTFSSCRTKGSPTCAHTANSCHYGGRTCGDVSYAVDISGNLDALATAAQACNASSLNEGNHIHVSVGAQNSCGCDASLD